MDPVTLTLLLTVLGGVVVVLLLLRTRTAFRLQIRDGHVQRVDGRPPPGFATACDDVCRLYRIDRGEIRGIRTGHGIELRFSPDIPARAHQPFRNVWTPPPRGGGGGGMRASG